MSTELAGGVDSSDEDEEKYPGGEWIPPIDLIPSLLDEVVNCKVLKLDWKNPGRRLTVDTSENGDSSVSSQHKSPVRKLQKTLPSDGGLQTGGTSKLPSNGMEQKTHSGIDAFDFEESVAIDDVPQLPQRKSGKTQPRPKRVANMDHIIREMDKMKRLQATTRATPPTSATGVPNSGGARTDAG